MRGFQPQNFADGGLVQGVKRMLGMDDEHNARIAAYRAQQAQEKERQKPAPAPAPERPVTEYAGMSAMKRREKAAGLDYANGGMVRGPGTGTSDDVPDQVPEGTYIMPADSTQAVGADKLAAMGARGFTPGVGKVPVNLSNGEFKLPPEQVHAVGVQALDQMKNATHTPVRGFAPRAEPEEPRQFFANGGVVDDEGKRQLGIFPNNSPDAGKNIYGATQATGGAGRGAAGFVADAFPKTTMAAQGAMQDAKDAYRQGGFAAALGQSARVAAAPLIGMADDVAGSAARAIDPAAQALKTFVTGDATPIGQQPSAAPSAEPGAAPAARTAAAAPLGGTANATDQRLAANTMTTPGGAPAKPGTPEAQQAAASAGKEVIPGVFQHGRGQYSDSADGMGLARGFTGQPSAQNMAAADALAGRQQQESMARVMAQPAAGFQPAGVAAPVVRHSGNDWQARNDLRNAQVSASSITQSDKWGKGGDRTATAQYQTMLAADLAARGLQPGMDQSAMRENAAIQREGMQQAGATDRAARGFAVDQQRLGVETRRADGESQARGFQLRAAEQQERLRSVLTDPKATAADKAQAQAALLALNGKGDSWKAVALQGGTDAQGNKTESLLGAVNERTGEMKRMDQGGLRTSAIPKVGEIRNGYRYKGGDPNDQASWEAT